MDKRKLADALEPLLADAGSVEAGQERAPKQTSFVQWASGFLGIGSAILYGTVAVSMNFVNKASMQMLPLPNVVMVMQMVATTLLLHPMREMGYLGFPPFSLTTCKRLFWITVLYTANVGFALFGLKTLNIPMYNVLKRLTPMMILIVKAIIRRRWPRPEISASVFLVVAGCVVAGIGDLAFDLMGYLFALMSCTMQAAYLLLVEFQGDEGVGTNEMLYYNAITSLPFLLAVVAATGEGAALGTAFSTALETHGAVSLGLTLASASLMGCLLNFALFLCTVNNSALTTTIVGVIKGVVAVFLGFFLLGGVKFSIVNVSGIALNTFGKAPGARLCGSAIWYTVIKYQEKRGGGGKRQAAAVTDSHASVSGSGHTLESASTGKLLEVSGLGSGVVIAGQESVAEAGQARVEVIAEGAWTGSRPAPVRRHAAA
ncbi:hypothetical protein GPECTOR_14g98 [Gonium pectorale]|uniref:Sugar phosphate transporter domain-containing protein n=1 Tax=Gonium pectorale TaxID=33097 RepID=A0A150GMT1_GONPE|nr:hypothetical protein GPECTOR_14g98 [Gonium pectorale]|eukprot:KXZ51117.1 hypothetical protein GPECTOR_14g98 [Gonium pectorale]